MTDLSLKDYLHQKGAAFGQGIRSFAPGQREISLRSLLDGGSTYQLRIYFVPYDTNWLRLQLMAIAPPSEREADALVRRDLFRNAVLLNLAHLKAKPNDRLAIFQSLINRVSAGSSFSGLESIYLTLIADPEIRRLPAYTQSLNLWNACNLSSVSDSYTIFYNFVGDRLVLLSPSALQTLKAGGANAGVIGWGNHLASGLESIAGVIINQPFSAHREERGGAVTREVARAPTESEVHAAHAKQLSFVAFVIGVAATACGQFEITAGAAVYLTAGATVVTGGAAYEGLVSTLTPNASVSVEITPGSGEGCPICPVCDQNGNLERGYSTQLESDGSGAQSVMESVSDVPVCTQPANLPPRAEVSEGGYCPELEQEHEPEPERDPQPIEGGEGLSGCLAASAIILMADGSWKYIDRVSAGDLVFWKNPLTGHFGAARVIEVNAFAKRETLRVTLANGNEVVVTAGHPFYHSQRARCLRAGHASEGVELAALTSTTLVVTKAVVAQIRESDTQTVYDLQVAAPRMYVGRAISNVSARQLRSFDNENGLIYVCK